MSNEKEQKPTVLEANLAFDASPALFESIMAEGPIKYGLDDDGIDMITTPEGDEVVDPRSIMDVNVNAPVQSGARFNSEIDQISQEEGDQYMSQFQDYIENIHKLEITDDDIDVAGATIQMLNNTRQDVAGYIHQQIADATARLSKQNVNPAQPEGVATDMTGDDRIPSEEVPGGMDAGMEGGMELGEEGAPDLGDGGLSEIDTTTHLTPEEDTGDAGLGDVDMGLGDLGSEPAAEPAPEAGLDAGADMGLGEEPAAPAEGEGEGEGEPASEEGASDDGDYDPFSDLDLGEGESAGEGEPASEEEPAPEEGASEEEPAPVSEDEGSGEGSDEPAGEADEGEEKDKKSEPLTESVYKQNFRACLESVINTYQELCKRRDAQAKCEAIVNAANKKMLAESVNQNSLKAKCESIVGAYRQATAKTRLKAKLESIVGKYRQQKMMAESVANSVPAMNQKPVMNDSARFAKMKAQCESIVNDFRKAESTANTAKAIIDSYKQSLV